MTCTSWRGISERIEWMLDHPPGESGMCAREVWQALGGDQSPPCPPKWGTADANAVYDAIINSGRYWTSTPIPDGAVIAWRYGEHGHAALAWQGGICTTDPDGNPGGVGLEPLDYPERWGASPSKRIWTDQYAGVRFDVGVQPGDVYLSKLVYGQGDSDSVRRLQEALNGHSLKPPGDITLGITGNYLDLTDQVVRADQSQHGYGNDPAEGSSVGPQQADHLFAGTGNTIINDLDSGKPETPEPPGSGEAPDAPEGVTAGYGTWDWYSGKHAGPVSIYPGEGWVDLPELVQPASGITDGDPREHHFIYTRWELTEASTARRVAELRFVRGDGDATAYDHRLLDPSARRSYPFPTYHTEAGSGLGGRWQARVTGGSDPATITTHYAKTEVEYREQPAGDDSLTVTSTEYGDGMRSVCVGVSARLSADPERTGLLVACLVAALR